MSRWPLSLAFLVASGLALSTGCAPQESALKETPGTATETKKDEAATSPAQEPPKTEPTATDKPLPDAPKDGDEVAVLDTADGKIVVMFYPERAPKNVANFKKLAKDGVYNGTRFHRCMPNFMIQGGDPTSKDMSKEAAWGTGGNEYTVEDEFSEIDHVRGVLSMANTGRPNSGGCQFFIVQADAGFLNGKYTAFGKVVKGLDVVDKIVATGPTDQSLNGKVEPKKAVVLKSVKIEKWPVKG